jgi:hypothetical protein
MTNISEIEGHLGKRIITETFTAGGYQEVIRYQPPVGNKMLRVRGLVTGSDLTGLKLTKRITPEGVDSDFLVDADLDTPFALLPWSSKLPAGPSLYLTPAGSYFEFMVDLSGIYEIGISVKSAGSGNVAFELAI